MFALFHGFLGQGKVGIVGRGNNDKVNVLHGKQLVGALGHVHPRINFPAIVAVALNNGLEVEVRRRYDQRTMESARSEACIVVSKHQFDANEQLLLFVPKPTTPTLTF